MSITSSIKAALLMLAGQQEYELRQSEGEYLLCSDCFYDQGLKLDAAIGFGVRTDAPCPKCNSKEGGKLDALALYSLVHQFFAGGTLVRQKYGAFPLVAVNDMRDIEIELPPWLKEDIEKIAQVLKIGLFYYGPRLWMLGQVEPLVALQRNASRPTILQRILTEYPELVLDAGATFYRLRKNVNQPEIFHQYDSSPEAGSGRLDSPDLPVLYGSQDLQICIHECRVTAEDLTYIATLEAKRPLRLLNLSHLLPEEDVSEFESLDIAVHMLFIAGKHAYSITRALARAARDAGFDGLVYPSYFSLLRTGGRPFATVMGISKRKIPELTEEERSNTVRNLAIFGRPIADGLVDVHCINRLVIGSVEYGFHFGPVGVDPVPRRR